MRKISMALLALLLVLVLVLPAAGADKAVTGLVTDDHGSPVRDAQVELIELGVGTVALGTTTAEGRYILSLPEVAPGPVYLVRVWAKGYGLGQTGWTDLSHSPLLDVSLSPSRATIMGQVQDARGSAVSGAAVQLLAGTTVMAETTADAGGAYSFSDLASGTYNIRVLAEGFDPYLSAVVTAAGGRFAAADVTLQFASGLVGGEVVDQASGLPLAGAHLMVVRQGVGIVARGDTDAAGRFSFPVPAASDKLYQVVAWATGYAPLQTEPTSLPGGAQVQYVADQSLKLSPASGGFGLYVTDWQNASKQGIEVQLELQGYGIVASAPTDDHGYAHFDQVMAGGQYRMRLVPHDTSQQTAGTGWVSVTPGQMTEFTLTMGAPNSGYVGRGNVTGRVQDRSGHAVANTTVELIRGAGGAVSTTTTGQDGRFTFNQVEANQGSAWQNGTGYMIRAKAEGYVMTSQFAQPAPLDTSASRSVTLTSGLLDVPTNGTAVANITLSPTVQHAAGYVLDNNGRSLAGATVSLWPQGAAQATTVTTDALGHYTLDLSQPGLPYLLFADRPGSVGGIAVNGPVATVDPQLSSFPVVSLNPDSATLTVRVADNLGRAMISGTQVTAFVPLTGEILTATADATGRVNLPGLPVNGQSLAITVGAPGYSSQALYPALPSLLTPHPGEQDSTATTLQPLTGGLDGEVCTVDGVPVAGAFVTLMQEGSGEVAKAQTDSGGHYQFQNLSVGPGARYVVRASASGYLLSSLSRTGRLIAPVGLNAGGTIHLDVQLNAQNAQEH